MASPLDPYQHLVHALTAQYGETTEMSIYRPAYDQAGTEVLIAEGIPMRLDPAGAGLQVQSPASGVRYSVVAGPKDIIRPGDVLIPTISDGSTPTYTVLQNLAMSDITAFKTNKKCTIFDTTRSTSAQYENVRFDFIAAPAAGEPIIPEFEGSKAMETNRAVLWTRENISRGKRLLCNGRRWLILATANFDNHTLLQLQGDSL